MQIVVTGPAGRVRSLVVAELRRSERVTVVGVVDDDARHDGGRRSDVTVTAVGLGDHLDGTVSSRELEVLHRIADGRTNAQIAADLYVSSETVKSHLKNLFRKLGVSSRLDAVAAATDAGLLRPAGRSGETADRR